MDYEEMRAKALNLAVGGAISAAEPAEKIVERAEKYFAFLAGKSTPSPR